MYTASTYRRTVSHFFDELLGSLFFIPLIVLAWAQMSRGEEILLSWGWVFGLLFARFVFEVLSLYILQALPVQYYLGLRVVSGYDSELGLSMSQCFIRTLALQLQYLLGPSIYFFGLLHKQRQHLGDLLADTRVMQNQPRDFKIKSRYILGSLLVFFALWSNLGQDVQNILEGQWNAEGISLDWPQIEIEF